LGLIASITAVVLPIVAIAGLATFVFSIIASLASGFGTTFPASTFAFSIGLGVYLLVLIILAILEFISFVLSMYKLSHYYNEPTIFRNLVYAILVALVSITVTAILEGVFIFASFAQLPNPPQNAPVFSGFIYLGIIAVSIGLSIVSGFFVMRTFNKLKDKSGIDSFGTAGLLYIVGTVVPIVGWIAWIFASIGFNKLKPTATQSNFYQTQYSITPAQTKSCPNCGTENPPDANYCGLCGKPIQ
jgi:uncharacterized membrane protein